ncbi:MAG: PilZ domain-containing protein [Nitrospirae bacterium]|nr:PilZ domain-containing protein [Nitrospirota bacterium]
MDKKGRLLLRSGHVIKDERELNRLRQLLGEEAAERSEESQNRLNLISISQQGNPFDLFRLIQQFTDNLFVCGINSAADSIKNFSQKVRKICSMIQELCYEDEDLALGAAFLDKDMRYTIKHPIHVAVICEVIAKSMNYSREERIPVLAAALAMNISVIELQEKLQSQSDPLTKEQRITLLGHPMADFKLLQRLGVTDKVWLTAVLQHHETNDGSGYPQGLKGSSISVEAQLISLTDIYTAMISSRTYRAPMPANEAMKKIFITDSQKVVDINPGLFVKHLGIYPPGTAISLQNGEVGIVTYRGYAIDQPVVQAIVKPDGMLHCTPQLRNTSLGQYKVAGPLSQKQIDFAINKEQIWGCGDFAKKGRDKRRHERVPISCSAELTPEGSSPIHVAILNVSISGCLVQIPFDALRNELREDKPCKLSLIVSGVPLLTDIRFIMRNVTVIDKGYNVGVKFIDMPDNYKATIEAYIESLKNSSSESFLKVVKA